MRVHHRPRVSHKVITRQKALFIGDNSLYLENLDRFNYPVINYLVSVTGLKVALLR